MGITVGQWRCSIGLFNLQGSKSPSGKDEENTEKPISAKQLFTRLVHTLLTNPEKINTFQCLILAAALVAILLVRAGIELNPGPEEVNNKHIYL